MIASRQGIDALPGTPDDTKLSNARDASNRFSSIASFVITGQALGPWEAETSSASSPSRLERRAWAECLSS